MRALISVSNKTGIETLARCLVQHGYQLLSTGGTFRYLTDHKIPVTSVESVTQFPEILDGRVKTLHPMIHAGLLAKRDNPVHGKTCQEHGIDLIDMLIVNLYPFQETVAHSDVTLQHAIEQIDIGGPAMIRSAAKNYQSVVVVVNPNRYDRIIQSITNSGTVPLALCQELAIEAFSHTANYDAAIASYLKHLQVDTDVLDDCITFSGQKKMDLRYGENPHQKAAFYQLSTPKGLSGVIQHHGKALSYNNIVDSESAWEVVRGFSEPTVAIIKHTNPCGVAVQDTVVSAYEKAYQADPVSAFGSIIGVNHVVDAATATAMSGVFIEAIVAPGYSDDALAILKKKPTIRLLELPDFFTCEQRYQTKFVLGGVLLQSVDHVVWNDPTLTTVTNEAPTDRQWLDLKIAFSVVKLVKSNAIVLVKDGVVIGVGAGQMSRVEATRLALDRVQGSPDGSVAASDAFFPFPDSIDYLANAGVAAVVQPGGSKKDEAVIQACNDNHIAMVMTGIRHFKH